MVSSEYSVLPSVEDVTGHRHMEGSSNTDFLLQPFDMSADPIGENMEGWDKRRGAMPVLVTPCIREIIDVDTVSQRATLRIDLCCDWIDDGALGIAEDTKVGYYLMANHFKPMIRIDNLVETLTDPEEIFWVTNVGGRVCVSSYLTQLVVVFCPMNLHEFPFDSQMLKVKFVSDMFSCESIEYRVRRTGDPARDLAGGVFLNKQAAEDSFPSFKFTGVSLAYDNRQFAHLAHYSYSSTYGVLSLIVHCHRCPYYYLHRIVTTLMMVAVLKMATSLIPLEDYNTKMGWDGGLFLTLVAFNFVVAQEVPKVSYTTRIDKLVISASVLMIVDIGAELILAFLATTVMPDQADLLNAIDTWRAISYLVLLLASTLWFFLPKHTRRV